MFGRGRREPLHGEVGDGMEGQVHQLTLEVVLVEVPEERLVGQLYDDLNEVAGGRVLEKDQKGTGRSGKTNIGYGACHGESVKDNKRVTSGAGASDLTPGAALRVVRYPVARLRSCLQRIGRFLWHTVNMVWNTALDTASVTLTEEERDAEGKGEKKCFLDPHADLKKVPPLLKHFFSGLNQEICRADARILLTAHDKKKRKIPRDITLLNSHHKKKKTV